LKTMYLLYRNAFDKRSGGSLASRDVDSESTRSPMAMVFVGSILGFAVLAFVMCTCTRYHRRRRNGHHQTSRRETQGIECNMKHYSDWKRTHSTFLDHREAESGKDNMVSEWDVAVCAICLEAVKDQDPIYELKCSHVFHFGCAKAWYDRQVGRTCPVCRNGTDIVVNVPIRPEEPSGS